MLSTYNLLIFWDTTHPTSVSVVLGRILRSQTSSGSADALRQLRKFVDRFAVTDVQRLKENDPKKVPIKMVKSVKTLSSFGTRHVFTSRLQGLTKYP